MSKLCSLNFIILYNKNTTLPEIIYFLREWADWRKCRHFGEGSCKRDGVEGGLETPYSR